MVFRRINVNLYPKTGFKFKESDGTTIVGNSWNGVIARVADYRKRAGLPPGDPHAEVHEQACRNNPAYCHQDSPERREKIKIATLKSRILAWFSTIRANRDREPIQFVSDQEARRRAEICARCPHNKALPDGCSSCRKALEEIRRDVIGDRFKDGRLNGCNVLGEDLQAAIHIDAQTVENGELPGDCPRRRGL